MADSGKIIEEIDVKSLEYDEKIEGDKSEIVNTAEAAETAEQDLESVEQATSNLPGKNSLDEATGTHDTGKAFSEGSLKLEAVGKADSELAFDLESVRSDKSDESDPDQQRPAKVSVVSLNEKSVEADELEVPFGEEYDWMDDEMNKNKFLKGSNEVYEETVGEEFSNGSLSTECTESLPDIEISDPSIALKDKIDREKLLETIREIYAIRQKEERKNFLLNKKIVEYFRRKKSLRPLHDDNNDMVYDFIEKYQKLLLKLDELKGQEEAMKMDNAAKLNVLQIEHDELIAKTKANTIELDKHLREVGLTCQSTQTGLLLSEKVIEKYIRKMTLLREQISEVRLELIKAQDKITAILLKTKQLEDLSDGLKVINFEQLRAETQSLGDKIEERNNELSKLRRRYNSDVHILAHVREKQFMLSKTIVVQEGVLRDLENEESSCRNYLNYIKLERDDLRKKFKEMSFDCGLLDKPALLRDYDRTVEKIEQIKLDIEELNETKEKILADLKLACERAESKMIVKSSMQKFDDALKFELANLDKLPYPRINQGIKPARNLDLTRYRTHWK